MPTVETAVDPPQLNDPLFDKEQFARAIHGTLNTADFLHRSGACRGIVVGRRLLWPRSVIERYLANRVGESRR